MDLVVLQMFSEVVRLGSFASVARQRNVSASSVSRSVAGLESELGVRLLHRTTRKLVPTEAGQLYYERIESVTRELESANALVTGVGRGPQGKLTVAAPMTLGYVSLLPALPEFLQECPDLNVRVILSNSSVDLLHERVDVALRVGASVDSSFVSVRLCGMRYVLCGSPAYLARKGTPMAMSDLGVHDFVLDSTHESAQRICFRAQDGERWEARVNGRVRVGNLLAVRECTLRGLGLAVLPLGLVHGELTDGRLTLVMPEYEVQTESLGDAVWLLYPTRDMLPSKCRVFVDFLKEWFRENPQWEGPAPDPGERKRNDPSASNTRMLDCQLDS